LEKKREIASFFSFFFVKKGKIPEKPDFIPFFCVDSRICLCYNPVHSYKGYQTEY